MKHKPQPAWNTADKTASLLAYAEWFHAQAVEMFLQDKTHGQILFLFTDDGLASMNPVPPTTTTEQLHAGVRQSIQEHNLYAIISISEAWTYFPKRPNDHTVVQLLHKEMQVADLKDEDRTEALMVRMESRDGDHLTWIDPVVRDGKKVALGTGMVLTREKCLKLDNYFEEA